MQGRRHLLPLQEPWAKVGKRVHQYKRMKRKENRAAVGERGRKYKKGTRA
jgi:hypothetical protein